MLRRSGQLVLQLRKLLGDPLRVGGPATCNVWPAVGDVGKDVAASGRLDQISGNPSGGGVPTLEAFVRDVCGETSPEPVVGLVSNGRTHRGGMVCPHFRSEIGALDVPVDIAENWAL